MTNTFGIDEEGLARAILASRARRRGISVFGTEAPAVFTDDEITEIGLPDARAVLAYLDENCPDVTAEELAEALGEAPLGPQYVGGLAFGDHRTKLAEVLSTRSRRALAEFLIRRYIATKPPEPDVAEIRARVILDIQHPGNCTECGHLSDCALHNWDDAEPDGGPLFGPCSCGAIRVESPRGTADHPVKIRARQPAVDQRFAYLDHVHREHDGACLKNRFGPRCAGVNPEIVEIARKMYEHAVGPLLGAVASSVFEERYSWVVIPEAARIDWRKRAQDHMLGLGFHPHNFSDWDGSIHR